MEEGKICPLVHQTAPLNNWVLCLSVTIDLPKALHATYLFGPDLYILMCVWWELVPEAIVIIGHKEYCFVKRR